MRERASVALADEPCLRKFRDAAKVGRNSAVAAGHRRWMRDRAA
jgi:hypothetical protein